MFMKLAGAATAVAGTAWASTPAGAQTSGQFKAIKALAFDAYGTLFDVFSVKRLATSPAETGSAAVEKTIGIVVVAALRIIPDVDHLVGTAETPAISLMGGYRISTRERTA